MKHLAFKFGLIFTMILLISCDGEAGLDGTVKDSKTGEKIADVKIEMTSYYKTINTMTDSSGAFYASHGYNCGIKKCDDSFTIKFEKEGYEKLELDENYRSKTDYVEIVGYNTIIKLTRLESE
ncbi:MAG: hypothetical protein ACK4VN_02560 [Bacteroidales bacterium]